MWIEKDDILVVIPAWKEEDRIGAVVKGVQSEGYKNILVIDDGSGDRTSELARRSGAKVLRHLINRGPGAATMTGLEWAKRHGFKFVITMDGDGQHLPEDLDSFVEAMNTDEADLIIGNRFLLDSNEIPFIRKIYNRTANLFTGVLAGGSASDSQSGFKLIGPKALDEFILHIDGYGFCSEMIIIASRQNLKVSEIPIQVLYFDPTPGKGQGFIEGIKTVWQLFQHKFFKH